MFGVSPNAHYIKQNFVAHNTVIIATASHKVRTIRRIAQPISELAKAVHRAQGCSISFI